MPYIVQGFLAASISVDDERMLSVLEQVSSNSSVSESGAPTQHHYRVSVYDLASAAQFCALPGAAASSPRPTHVFNLEPTRFASSARSPLLFFVQVQRKRTRATGAAAEEARADDAAGELLLRRALVLENDLALHYFGKNGTPY